jgi:hypothetical protein
MFDPAALGTLIIGLDAVRRDDDRPPRAPRQRRPARLDAVRLRLATSLRRIARTIDPSPAPAR